MIEGGCLCGAVRYAITGPLADIQVCHCHSCQKAQGGPFATNIPVDRSCFEWLGGQAHIRSHESSPGKHHLFCGCCGSPLISRRDDAPQTVRVRAGTLDRAPAVRIAVHAFTAEAVPWWHSGDKAPRFAGPRPKIQR